MTSILYTYTLNKNALKEAIENFPADVNISHIVNAIRKAYGVIGKKINRGKYISELASEQKKIKNDGCKATDIIGYMFNIAISFEIIMLFDKNNSWPDINDKSKFIETIKKNFNKIFTSQVATELTQQN